MKLAEKIVTLRKQKGYSQEELAEKLNVSRQAVSRWEMDTALPDATNILQLSKLFEVSTDYLLNEEYQSDQDIPAVKHHKDFLLLVALQIMSFLFHIITCLFLKGFFVLQIISLALNLFFAKKLYVELQTYDILSEIVKKYYVDMYVTLIWFITYIATFQWAWIWRVISDEINPGMNMWFIYTFELLIFIPIIKLTINKIKGGKKP